jgi:hypothetical protein
MTEERFADRLAEATTERIAGATVATAPFGLIVTTARGEEFQVRIARTR